MLQSTRVRAPTFRLLKNCALFLCLFAPSAWMIATIPPLWRDADAHNQVALDPLVATFWGHGPAYCYLAKVPLLIGEHWERSRGITSARRATESSQPRLTDSGVWLLIVGQHLALCAAAFYFITAISRFFLIRLALGVGWATNAIFYTYAHCVGSETLSMIFVILLAAQALRLIQNRRQPQWTDWYIFALALCICILSRHVNLCLVSLLPAVLLLAWAQTRAAAFRRSGDRHKLWLRGLATRYFRHAIIAIAVGVACLAVANSLPRDLARKTRFHPHSRVGFTFLSRLHFLVNLSSESRESLFRKVTARTRSPEVRQLIAVLEQIYQQGAGLNDGAFLQRAIQIFHGPLHWEELDQGLNQMALTFLLPPAPELLHVATTDFVAALKIPVTEVSDYLFGTTAYYFQHKDEMPGCANLVTFRDTTEEQISSIPFQRAYFRLWQGLTLDKAIVIWLITLLLWVITARGKGMNAGAVTALGIVLTLLGLLMFASTCLLADDQPRFRLPMWELLLLSLYIFIGKTAELFATKSSSDSAASGKVRRAAL